MIYEGVDLMEKKLNIVIAEDEYIVMMGLKQSVENSGHNVIGIANDGVKLIELALERNPDLLIVDINLPKMDGIKAIEMINRNSILPSIIITGYNSEDFVKRANKAGVLYYLIKPVDEKELNPAIEITMGRFEDFVKMQNEIQEKDKALSERKFIERAKGIIMNRNNLKEREAMKVLQKKSRDSNIKLIDVAKDIISAERILKIE